MNKEKTIGEKVVRTDFNVSGSNEVAEFKNKCAGLVNDMIEVLKGPIKGTPPNLDGEDTAKLYEERRRLALKALNHLEAASMYGVKALTTTEGTGL